MRQANWSSYAVGLINLRSVPLFSLSAIQLFLKAYQGTKLGAAEKAASNLGTRQWPAERMSTTTYQGAKVGAAEEAASHLGDGAG